MTWIVTLILLLIAQSAWADTPSDIYFNSFEFSDMQQVAGNAMPTVAAGEQPSAPAGICRGTAASGVCTGLNFITFFNDLLQLVNDPGNCHSGDWCLRANIAAGDISVSGQEGHDTALFGRAGSNPGSISMGCSTTSGSASSCLSYNNYFRMWIRWQNNFFSNMGLGSDGSGVCQGKFMYVSGYIGEARPGFTVRFVLQTGTNTVLVGIDNADGGVSNSFVATSDGAWHSIEVNQNSTNQLASIWYDDVLQVNNFSWPLGSPYTPMDAEEWGMFFNQPGNGDCSATIPITFWVDDFEVSTQRIGGGGGDTTSPSIAITGPTSSATYLTRFTPLAIALGFGITMLWRNLSTIWALRKEKNTDGRPVKLPDQADRR